MGGMRVADPLGFLAGHWQIDRVLVDRRAGIRGRFTGSAAILLAAGGQQASYTEWGELRFGQHTGPAQRRLGLAARPDGSIQVRFADGRPFYVLDLRSGRCQAEHPCRADHYQLSHVVHSADLIEERWLVSGPDKDYQAITRVRRKPLQDGPIHRTIDGNNAT